MFLVEFNPLLTSRSNLQAGDLNAAVSVFLLYASVDNFFEKTMLKSWARRYKT